MYCTATLARLSPGQRWWFPSCTTCHKTSLPEGSAFKCSDPECLGTDALPRYLCSNKLLSVTLSDCIRIGCDHFFIFFYKIQDLFHCYGW
jgi:hypothetical protein